VNPIRDFAWTSATLAKGVFQLRYMMPRRAGHQRTATAPPGQSRRLLREHGGFDGLAAQLGQGDPNEARYRTTADAGRVAPDKPMVVPLSRKLSTSSTG
jgi:hypothetical protein